MSLAHRVPVHVVPQVGGHRRREPGAVEGLVHREVFAAERLYRSVQQRCRSRVPVGVQHGHPREQHIGFAGNLRPGRLARHPRHLSHGRGRSGGQTPGGRSSRQRVQVGLPGDLPVERLEPARRGQQHRDGLVPRGRVVGDLRAQQVYPCLPGYVEGARLGGRDETQRLLERTGGRLGLGGLDRASCPPSSVRGERGRRLQTGGCCRKPAVRERSVSGTYERCRDRFVGAHRRPGEVPCSAVRVDVRVGDLGEGTVDLPPFRRCRRVVDRRADERMPKPDAIAQLDQPGRLGRGRRIGTDAQLIRRPPPQDDVARRLRGRSQQQLPGLPWEETQLAHEPSLEVDQGPGVARPGAPEGQLRRRQASRQLQESEWIAV